MTDLQTGRGQKSTVDKSWMRMGSVACLVLQYSFLIVTMRWIRTKPGPVFFAPTAVFLSEILKTVACTLGVGWQDKCHLNGWLQTLKQEILFRPMEWTRVAIPSFIFVVQNNLVYVAVSNLDATVFQVTYQLKILTTALFSVLMLNKQLSRTQWVALAILFVGVATIQVHPTQQSSTMLRRSPTTQNPTLGLFAVLTCCLLSGFANVFFEKVMKDGRQGVLLRNIQLGSSGVIFGGLAVWIFDGNKIRRQGFFYGYSATVWAVISLQAVGGLIVAAVIKYADNIMKGFATAVSILLSCVASIYIFNFRVTMEFAIGTTLVILAVYLYGSFPSSSSKIHIDIEDPVINDENHASD